MLQIDLPMDPNGALIRIVKDANKSEARIGDVVTYTLTIQNQTSHNILGVLIESNVYQGRTEPGQVMVRVMLGGMHHPEILNEGKENIITKAVKEMDLIYGLKGKPIHTFVKVWPKGIPQYELNYPQLRKTISEKLTATPHLYLCANYLEGISFNDCVNQAKSVASRVIV